MSSLVTQEVKTLKESLWTLKWIVIQVIFKALKVSGSYYMVGVSKPVYVLKSLMEKNCEKKIKRDTDQENTYLSS